MWTEAWDVVSKCPWASEMAQRIKAFAAKSEDLSLMPRAHRVEGENQFLLIVIRPTHTQHIH